MELRSLGRSGLQVSPLCLGGNVFGWTVDEATSHSLLGLVAAAQLQLDAEAIDTIDAASA